MHHNENMWLALLGEQSGIDYISVFWAFWQVDTSGWKRTCEVTLTTFLLAGTCSQVVVVDK